MNKEDQSSAEEIRLREIQTELEKMLEEMTPSDGLRFAMASAINAIRAALSMIDQRFD